MFQGYLLKSGSSIFPHQYIAYETYQCTPKQRQDLDAYQDSLGNLHRNVVEHDRSKIIFSTLNIDLAGKMAIQAFFSAAMVNARERKCSLEYWDDENNTYSGGYFYIPDVTFTIKEIDGNNIKYAPIEFHLIEY